MADHDSLSRRELLALGAAAVSAAALPKPLARLLQQQERVDLRGRPLSGIKVEIWQANARGRYSHTKDTNPAPLDPNFQGYGVQITDSNGRYRFKTIKPGADPTGIGNWSRPPHVHFDVTGRHEALVTQMYFPNEPLNAKDQLLQSAGRDSRP